MHVNHHRPATSSSIVFVPEPMTTGSQNVCLFVFKFLACPLAGHHPALSQGTCLSRVAWYLVARNSYLGKVDTWVSTQDSAHKNVPKLGGIF